MSLDYDQFGNIAYADFKIADHKTKHSTAFKNCFLHACAPASGILDDDWIGHWMRVRAVLGVTFDKGHPTMPAPLDGGGISIRPLSSEEMKQWTHLLLRSCDNDIGDRRLTSHVAFMVCKARATLGGQTGFGWPHFNGAVSYGVFT